MRWAKKQICLQSRVRVRLVAHLLARSFTTDEQDAVKGGLKWKNVRGKIRKVVKEVAPYVIKEEIKYFF